MKKIYILLIILFIPTASAHNITFYLQDLNTLNPLYNVTIILSNETGHSLGSLQTNTDGFAKTIFADNTYNYYLAKYSKLGYFDTSTTQNLSENGEDLVSMTPISTNGIVKLNFDDMTGAVDDICIYYKDNSRLHGCYKTNDTIRVVVNREYIIYPKIDPTLTLITPDTIRNYMPFYAGSLITLLMMVAFILAFIALFLKWRAKK